MALENKTSTKKGNLNSNNDDTIDLLKLARVLLAKWWLILIVGVLFAGGTYAGTGFLIKPTYRSYFTAYINNKTEVGTSNLSTADISASRNLVSTYQSIIESRSNIEHAIEENGLNLQYDSVKTAIEVSQVNNTEIISVSVITTDPHTSLALAKALQDSSADYVESIVEGSSMRVVEQVRFADKPYGPDYIRYGILGGLAGVVLVCAILILRDLLDTRIRSKEDLENRFDVIVIGTIHDLNQPKKGSGYGYYGYGAEQKSEEKKQEGGDK